MPNMANIVVKQADGTTDFTYSVLSAAPGDGGFAQWRGDGVYAPTRPNLRVKTSWNGNRTARQVEASGDFPVQKVIDGVWPPEVLSRISFRFSLTVPENMLDSSKADGTAVILNALASTLMKSVASTGVAPT